ncbi:MAG: right-handed parallel beta-helix repeat-containing protein [bacterium]|nr:right-handed parallel beta-helix repeat-containing protein [bacterium]
MAIINVPSGANIQTYVNSAANGDILRLSGVYRQDDIDTSGKSNLIFETVPGEPPAILKGSVNATSGVTGGWVADGGSRWYTVLNWTVTPNVPNYTPYFSTKDGISTQRWVEYGIDVFVTDASDNMIDLAHAPALANVAGQQRFYYDNTNGRLYIGVNPASYALIEISKFKYALSGSGTNITLDNIQWTHYATDVQDGAVVTDEGTGWTIRGCSGTFNHGTAVKVGTDTTIENCQFDDNGQLGLNGNNELRFYGYNVFLRRNNRIGVAVEFEAGGYKLARFKESVVRNWWASYNDGKGHWIDIDNELIWLDRVMSIKNTGPGIHYEISYKGAITNARTFQNALDYSTGDYGGEILVANSSRVYLYNNFLVIGGDASNGYTIWLRNTDRSSSSTYGFAWKTELVRAWANRMFYKQSNVGRTGGRAYVYTTEFDTNLFDQNTYYPIATGQSLYKFNGSASYSFTGWQGLGQDPNGTETTSGKPAGWDVEPTRASWPLPAPNTYTEFMKSLPGLLFYLPLTDAAGSSSAVGHAFRRFGGTVENSTGVTFGQSGIGNGDTSVRLTRANSGRLSFYAALFESDWDKNSWMFGGWFRVADAAVWTDGNNQEILRIGTNGTAGLINLYIRKMSTPNNTIRFLVQANNLASQTQDWSSGGTTGWVHAVLGFRYDVPSATGELRYFINGTQIGTDSYNVDMSSLGIDNIAKIGSSGTSFHFDGWVSHFFGANWAPTQRIVSEIYNWTRPPLITGQGEHNYQEGQAVNIPVVASAPGGGTLTYEAFGLPAGITINSSGVLQGTLGNDAKGQYLPRVRVTNTIAGAPAPASETILLELNVAEADIPAVTAAPAIMKLKAVTGNMTAITNVAPASMRWNASVGVGSFPVTAAPASMRLKAQVNALTGLTTAAVAAMKLKASVVIASTDPITAAPASFRLRVRLLSVVESTNYLDYGAGSYRLALGWIPRAELTELYEIWRWPRQFDQGYRQWIRIPSDDDRLLNDYAEDQISFGGSAVMVGQGENSWTWTGLTPGMMNYLAQTKFDGKNWGEFTIMDWDRERGWRTLWVYGYLKRPSDAGEPGYRKGFKSRRVEWVIEQDAPAGPDPGLTLTHTSAPATTGQIETFSVVVSNDGDALTTGSLVVTMPIPATSTLNSWSGTGWTLEWFNGSWSSTPPGLLSSVTQVRATRSTALVPGGTSTLTLGVTFASTGAKTVEATLTADLDTNNFNNNRSIGVTVS